MEPRDYRKELTALIETTRELVTALVDENLYLRGQVDGLREKVSPTTSWGATGTATEGPKPLPEEFRTCERCEQPFPGSGRQKVCDKCFRIISVDKTKYYQRQKRSKNSQNSADESRV